MDAMAVSAAKGLAASEIRARHVALVAGLFGGFQASMPLAGWALGRHFGPLVADWDHWIAFVLLGAIGAKMIWEARAEEETGKACENPFALGTMFVLAIATSIDAFAAGITLPILNAPLALSLATIGTTTAGLSALGLFAGRRFGAALGRRLDVAGGLVLIGLGVKILVQHLAAA